METTLPIPAVLMPETPQTADGSLRSIDLLLRNPQEFVALIDDEALRPTLARTMLLTIALGAAAFGLSVGIYRGGVQTIITAAKLPLVELVLAVLSAPALCALNGGVGGRTTLHRDFIVLLSALARATLALAGLAPVMLLASCYSIEYHRTILVLVGCCTIAGVLGLSLLVRGMPRSPRGTITIATPVIVLLMIVLGAQVTWTFRPYIGRPAQENVPLVRGTESNFFDAASTSLQSAQGIYRSP